MPLAAVTGATGFVGQRLVAALAAQGWTVRALVRAPPADDLWGGAAVETVRGDLRDEAALATLARDADVVFHGAGVIKARVPAEFHGVNVEGTHRMAEAATGRVVLISSLAAREPKLSPYAASKRAGETIARFELGERLAVVRPPAIYGPGDRQTLAAFRWATSGAPLPLPARARVALTHVDDVVATLIAVAQNPALSATYAVGGARPEGYEWREVLEAAARAVGRRARFLPAPGPLVWSAGALSEAFGGLAGQAPMFTRGKAREFLHRDWSVAPEDEAPGAPKARFDLDQGFAETVAWYRDHGWLS